MFKLHTTVWNSMNTIQSGLDLALLSILLFAHLSLKTPKFLIWNQACCFPWKNIVKGFSMKTTTLISKKMSSVALLFTHWTYSQENFFQGSLDSTLNGRRGQDLRPPRCALKTQEVPPPPHLSRGRWCILIIKQRSCWCSQGCRDYRTGQKSNWSTRTGGDLTEKIFRCHYGK